MSPTSESNPEPATRELLHAVNNFLNVVLTTGQVGLDRELDYAPERALESILLGAEELRCFVRRVQSLQARAPEGPQPARSQEPPVAAGPLE